MRLWTQACVSGKLHRGQRRRSAAPLLTGRQPVAPAAAKQPQEQVRRARLHFDSNAEPGKSPPISTARTATSSSGSTSTEAAAARATNR